MSKKPTAAVVRAREAEVKGLLGQLAHEVDALPEPALRSLFPILQEAQKELERDLTRWLSRLDGEERFTTQHLRTALLQVNAAVEKAQKRVPDLKKSYSASALRAAKLAQTHLQREVAFFSVRFGGSLNPTPLLEAAKVVDHALLDEFDASIRKWGPRTIKNIRKRLAISLAKKETVEQMQRRLVGRSAKYLTPLATQAQKAKVVSRVLWSQAEVDARRIVRTEVINAYNSTKLDMLDELRREDKKWGKRWDAALDYRICARCRALDGIVVPANEKFPTGVSAPPLHPNCRCAVVAWHLDWEPEGASVRFRGAYVAPEGSKRPSRSPRSRP